MKSGRIDRNPPDTDFIKMKMSKNKYVLLNSMFYKKLAQIMEKHRFETIFN